MARRFLSAKTAAVLVLALAVCGVLSWEALCWIFPLPEKLLQPTPASTRYLARDGSPLRHLPNAEGWRSDAPVDFQSLPQRFINATLAAEDRRFFSHGGVDLLAVLRAARDNLRSGRIVSGASTLEQQLIKISSEKTARTWWVKFRQAMQARRLARMWSKERILATYLNRVSYGNLMTGCAAAATGCFNKPLQDLTHAECALLAALPQAPGRLNPFRDLEAVRPRQQRILRLMHDHGMMTQEQFAVALAESITLQRFNGGFAAPHAVDMLTARAGTKSQDRSSPEVRTSLDAPLQRAVEAIITGRLTALKERHVTQAAVVVIENANGHVLALAGSRDFFAPEGGQINGAWTPHSPGSAIKPFTFLTALERGFTPASIIADLPVEYPTPTGIYRPENYAHKHHGPMTLRVALGSSLNIPAVKLLDRIGGPEVLLQKLQELGLTSLTEPAEHYGLGLTIGNAPVRLIELASAYACIARLGMDKPWTLLADAPVQQGARRFEVGACYLIADILSDNQARLLTFGAHSPLRLPFPVAIKTGTSTSYRDNWTVGFTPEFTVGVWAGNFDNSPMQDVSGVTGAAPIFRDVFLELRRRFGVSWFAEPEGIVHARIDPRTGKLLTPQSPPARMSRDEIFAGRHLPAPAHATDYDDRGRALLGPEYADWAKSADNWLGDLVVVADKPAPSGEFRITHPIPGTVVRLDPDIRAGGSRLILQAGPRDQVQWESGTLSLQRDGGRWVAVLVPGRHEITAIDPGTGQHATTFVIVHPE